MWASATTTLFSGRCTTSSLTTAPSTSRWQGCPVGWVVSHLEMAGFEVQNVYNLGNHYSRTLFHWQQMWESKEAEITKAYGPRSYRRWRVFLAWSVRIARRGGSTVNFITATKSGQEAARVNAQDRIAPGGKAQ